MSSITFFFFFIAILAAILLAVNLLLAPHNPYKEKNSVFECGYHSFLGQNRSQFSISFFIFALLFLLFDIEILLVYPYVTSSTNNEKYGLTILIVFFALLTLGFVYELGKGALKISSRQYDSIVKLQEKYISNILDLVNINQQNFVTLSIKSSIQYYFSPLIILVGVLTRVLINAYFFSKKKIMNSNK